MTDRELFRQALEALEWAADHTAPDTCKDGMCPICLASDALRERLARQDELEPPMALVLADVLEQRHAIDGCNSEMQAAAELRRLHGLLFGDKK